jgi:hypothetical protein
MKRFLQKTGREARPWHATDWLHLRNDKRHCTNYFSD